MIARMTTERVFRTRSVEMLLATVMLLQGVVFLLPGDTLSLPHYAELRTWVDRFPGSEDRLGVILIVVGFMRWGALIVNGYWCPSPKIRAAGCVMGSLYWAMLTISFLAHLQGVPAAVSWTATAIGFEILSALRCAKDAVEADRIKERHNVRQYH